MKRHVFIAGLLALAASFSTTNTAGSQAASAQSASDDWRITLTIFRSPGTGIQVSKGHFAGFVGHYPTIIKRDGKQQNTQFIRFGVAAYARPASRTSPYLSLSLAPSLTRGWPNSGLVDVGVRQMFTSRLSGQLGAALLYAPSTEATRFNPTVGLGVRF